MGTERPPDESVHLALVILAYPADPERVGDVAFVPEGPPLLLGRERAAPPDRDLVFARQRPGELAPRPSLSARTLSRRHALFRASDRCIRVENLGKSSLYLDGVETNGPIDVGPGDTLSVGRTLLLACSERGERMPAARTTLVPERFGAVDPVGFAGESELAWKLRERVATAAATDEPVVLVGRRGSGRGLAAKMLHAASARREREPILLDASLLDADRATARIAAAVASAHGSTVILERAHVLPPSVQSAVLEMRSSPARFVLTVDDDVDPKTSLLLQQIVRRVVVPSRESRIEDAWAWLVAAGANPQLYDVEAMETFLGDLRDRGFAALGAIARSEEPTNEAPIPSLPPSLERELHIEMVREALRSFHDDTRLSTSKLAGSKAVRARADAATVADALRATLGAAIERLEVVRERDLLRETYLVPAAAQLVIAERLRMPYDTYLGLLGRATERLAERLWLDEHGK